MRVVEHVARVVGQGEIVLCHVAGIPPQLLEHPGAESPAGERELEQSVGQASRAHDARAAESVERELFEPARARLSRHASAESKLKVSTRLLTDPHGQVPEVLLAEVQTGRYDALAVGWHPRSGLGHLLSSTVSSKLIDHLRTGALWLVP